MNEAWLNALRCPKTGGVLTLRAAEGGLPEGLFSEQANLLFPLRDGIPILLIEQAIDLNDLGSIGGAGHLGSDQ